VSRTTTIGLAIALVLVAAGAWLLLPNLTTSTVPYPAGCAELHLSDGRCAAIVEALVGRAGINEAKVREIALVRQDGWLAAAQFRMTGGRTRTAERTCGGIERELDILCTDEPAVILHTGIDRDVPCVGEPPDGCASPPPSIDPWVAAMAVPLTVDALDIPIDHAGRYEVPLGIATIPNGMLTERTLAIPDSSPDGMLFSPDGIDLEVRSTEDGDLVDHPYAHGWRPGLEWVDVRLVFVITQADPGAVLEVRDIVVR
jgi:hypothetical protein